MRYLKRYNEATDSHKALTGYTKQELLDIFTISLEDNTDFEIIEVYVMDGVYGAIIEIIEDFNNSKNVELLSPPVSNNTQASISLIKMINTKLLNVIGKKYDLDVSACDVRVLNQDVYSANKYKVMFVVKKNTTAL